MPIKYQNTYRIPSARLQSWDYSSSAAYFITICTANRAHFFGEIINGQMHLSELGQIAEQEWLKSVALRPDMNLSLGEYVVMPNHFHAIIFIGDNKYNTTMGLVDKNGLMDTNGFIGTNGLVDTIGRDAMHGVSTGKTEKTEKTPSPFPTNPSVNQFGPQSKNLASVVRGFKSAVTTYARKNNILFDWQSRFHDHIIRNKMEYQRIANYIMNNPAQWEQDKFYVQL
jgi:putative transposase